MRRARTLPALGLAVLLLLLLASPSTAATPFRMVGKGSIAGTVGGVASYAYIVNCDSSANTNAPFEVRFGSQAFRLTGTSAVGCTDDAAVDNPARSFDTQTGSGAGTLTSGGPGTIEWEFVDEGLGGASDSARITIRDLGGTTRERFRADNAGAPFEVRFGAQVFRLTGTSLVACSDDPTVLTPPAGFDTQTGSGSGTLTTRGPGTIAWKFVDGGLG